MAINLGSITTLAGRSVTSGSASGIDTAKLIEDLTKARRDPAIKLEEKQTLNKSRVSALGTLRTKFSALKASLNALRNPPGFLNSSQNIFKSRLAFVTSNTAILGNTYLGVSAEAGAAITSYDITISALAKAKAQRTNTFTSNTTSVTDAAGTNNAGRFSAGTFQISGQQIKADIGTAGVDILSSAT